MSENRAAVTTAAKKVSFGTELLFLGYIVAFWFAHYLVSPYLTIYIKSWGTTAFVAGLIAGAYGFIQIFARMPIGAMADQLSKPVVLTQFGAASLIVSTLLICFGQSEIVFLIARLISGVSASAWVVMLSMYVKMHRERSRTESLGRAMAAQYVGILSAYIIAGIVRSKFEMQTLLLMDVFAAVACFILGFFVKKDDREPQKETISLGRRLLTVIRDRQVLRGSFLFCFSQFVVFATAFSFTANYVKEVRNVSDFQVSVLAALFSLATLIGNVMVDRGLERILSDRNSTVLSFAMMLTACICFPLISNYFLLCVMQVLIGLAYGFNCAVLNGFAVKDTAKEYQSAAIGCFQALHCIAVTIAPIIMGKLVDVFKGYTLPYWILAALCITAIILTFVFFGIREKQ